MEGCGESGVGVKVKVVEMTLVEREPGALEADYVTRYRSHQIKRASGWAILTVADGGAFGAGDVVLHPKLITAKHPKSASSRIGIIGAYSSYRIVVLRQ